MGSWMGSLDRSREGEDVGVGLAHVGGLVQVLEGLKDAPLGEKAPLRSWQPWLTRSSRPAGTGSRPATRDSGKAH